jgi:lysophospholipid acyltransferase (LPLAT)-like uncharacterized protein
MITWARKFEPFISWFWRAGAWPAAWILAAETKIELATSDVSVQGPAANYSGAAIYVNWHKYVPFLCVHHGQRKRWLLVSGAPYMDSIARWCRIQGLTVVRSAAGDRGRKPLAALIEALGRGESVVLAVDGPSGPGFQVKRGCIDIARASGAPIIPVAYRCRRGRCNMKRWDHWLRVKMFDTIEVRYGDAIFLSDADSDDKSIQRVHDGLVAVGEDV